MMMITSGNQPIIKFLEKPYLLLAMLVDFMFEILAQLNLPASTRLLIAHLARSGPSIVAGQASDVQQKSSVPLERLIQSRAKNGCTVTIVLLPGMSLVDVKEQLTLLKTLEDVGIAFKCG